MATKAAEKVTAEGEKIEIDKSQLDSILAQQEEMKATIALAIAWRRAGSPTKRWPSFVKAT